MGSVKLYRQLVQLASTPHVNFILGGSLFGPASRYPEAGKGVVGKAGRPDASLASGLGAEARCRSCPNPPPDDWPAEG